MMYIAMPYYLCITCIIVDCDKNDYAQDCPHAVKQAEWTASKWSWISQTSLSKWEYFLNSS